MNWRYLHAYVTSSILFKEFFHILIMYDNPLHSNKMNIFFYFYFWTKLNKFYLITYYMWNTMLSFTFTGFQLYSLHTIRDVTYSIFIKLFLNKFNVLIESWHISNCLLFGIGSIIVYVWLYNMVNFIANEKLVLQQIDDRKVSLINILLACYFQNFIKNNSVIL